MDSNIQIDNFKEALLQEDIDNIDIFRESTTDNSTVVVFTRLKKSNYQQTDLLDHYVKNNPIEGISANSLSFLEKTSRDYYYILLGKFDSNSTFLEQDIDFIHDNKLNHLSKKITNEIVDFNKNFEALFDKYSYRAGFATIVAGKLVTELAQSSLELFDKRGKVLLDKSNEKVSAALTQLKNKLKM